jgi:hypothetical protein
MGIAVKMRMMRPNFKLQSPKACETGRQLDVVAGLALLTVGDTIDLV